MKKLIVILTMMLTVSLPAGVRVDRVRFTGDRPGSDLSLYNRRNIVFEPDSLSGDSLRIAAYFQGRGWYDCRVEYSVRNKPDRVEIEYRVIKNSLYRLEIPAFRFPESDSSREEIDSLISFYEGRPATSKAISDLADDLISFFSARGYPYCDVRFGDLLLEKPDRLIVEPDIQPGPKVTIDEIDFEGRRNLEKSFLEKYIGMALPAVFSEDDLSLARKRLSRAAFLTDASDYRLHYRERPENGVVVFPIKEASPLTLDGAAGYSARDDEFYGKFNVSLANILGRGRQAGIEWAKKDKSSRWLSFSFVEPYPLGLPFTLKLDISQEDRDSIFIENNGSLGLDYLVSDIYSYGITAGFSRLNPEAYGRSFLPHKDKIILSVRFTADTRDYPANARRGDYMRLGADFVTETSRQDSLFPAATANYRTAELRLEKYLPLSESSVLYGGLSARGDFSENVPVDRLSPLGGFGSLRGYMQDQFYTSRQARATIEYRLLTSRQGRAYIFSDGALFQMPGSLGEGSSTEFKTGLGIGIAAAVNFGIAIVEFAVPSAEGFTETKLHFGLKAGF